MSVEDSSTPVQDVQDGTDLTKLVGTGEEYQEYARLASLCFADDEVGNTTWRAAKTFTMEDFLKEFAAEKPTRRAKLQAWIRHYQLETRFKQLPVEQPNGELLCSRIHFCIQFVVRIRKYLLTVR
jgi:hypothetical protein